MSLNLYKNIIRTLISERYTKTTGRPNVTFDTVFDGIVHVLRTGCQWRSLSLSLKSCSWQTVHRYFTFWSKQGIFRNAYQRLLSIYKRKNSSKCQRIITDCTFIKNVFGRDCLGRCPVDRGRWATKLSVICDDVGVVLAFSMHPANKCDHKAFLHTLTQSHNIDTCNKVFLADRAYDNKVCDSTVQKYGMINACLRRKTHGLSTYQGRHVVEHVFGWLDRFRRLIVRYDKAVVHFKSFTYLGLAHRVCRVLDEQGQHDHTMSLE